MIVLTLEVTYTPTRVSDICDTLFEFNSQKKHVGRKVCRRIEVRCEIYLSMDPSLVLVVYLPGGPTLDNSFIRVLYDLSLSNM